MEAFNLDPPKPGKRRLRFPGHSSDQSATFTRVPQLVSTREVGKGV